MESGEKALLEFKARYEDLGKARALLAGSEHLGTFRQVDTYFSLGERRLKLRTVEGRPDGQLIYYERPDEGGVKASHVSLASVPDGRAVRDILTRALPVKVEVRKTREIYIHQGVQVHLDTVDGLGRFIEFEKVVPHDHDESLARKALEALRAFFQVSDDDVMASSYSDLLERTG